MNNGEEHKIKNGPAIDQLESVKPPVEIPKLCDYMGSMSTSMRWTSVSERPFNEKNIITLRDAIREKFAHKNKS